MILAVLFAASVVSAGAGAQAAGAGAQATAAAAPTCKTADQRVEALVTAQVQKAGGNEYCQFRLYHTLDDLDGDGRADFVIVFTVEPRDGNRTVQYLAVLPSSRGWKPLVIQVGVRGERNVDRIEVQEGRSLLLRTSEYTPADAMCCPSGKGELKYRFDKGVLTTADGKPVDIQSPR